jgi:hypothetical protein
MPASSLNRQVPKRKHTPKTPNFKKQKQPKKQQLTNNCQQKTATSFP